jgi:hypothetical protein
MNLNPLEGSRLIVPAIVSSQSARWLWFCPEIIFPSLLANSPVELVDIYSVDMN